MTSVYSGAVPVCVVSTGYRVKARTLPAKKYRTLAMRKTVVANALATTGSQCSHAQQPYMLVRKSERPTETACRHGRGDDDETHEHVDERDAEEVRVADGELDAQVVPPAAAVHGRVDGPHDERDGEVKQAEEEESSTLSHRAMLLVAIADGDRLVR